MTVKVIQNDNSVDIRRYTVPTYSLTCTHGNLSELIQVSQHLILAGIVMRTAAFLGIA